MITYREAKRDEIEKIAKLTTKSFGDYPFFKFAFEDKLKSDMVYYDYMDKLHLVHIKANMYKYKCFVGIEKNQIVSAVIIQNPNVKRVTLFDYIKAGGVKLLFPVGFVSLINFFNISEEAHKPCEKMYKNSWYIEMIAVDNDLKGKGLGSDMFKHCIFPYIKKFGAKTLTLITNTKQNCSFYEKNGFTLFSKTELSSHGKSVDNYCFVSFFD